MYIQFCVIIEMLLYRFRVTTITVEYIILLSIMIICYLQAKGYDTSQHILASFGGAGGQHACAIARSLGMSTIFIHRCVVRICIYTVYMCILRTHKFIQTCGNKSVVMLWLT